MRHINLDELDKAIRATPKCTPQQVLNLIAKMYSELQVKEQV